MAKDFLKSDPIADLEAQLNSDFNTVIRKAHKSLGTKTHSPVYTGFFASSWKVANTPPKVKVKDLQIQKYNLDLKLLEHLILRKLSLLVILLSMLLML